MNSTNTSSKNNNNSTTTATSVVITDNNNENVTQTIIQRLPWGSIKEKNFNILNVINSDNKKPGEYIMHLIFHNFVTISSKKIEQILYGDRRVRIAN